MQCNGCLLVVLIQFSEKMRLAERAAAAAPPEPLRLDFLLDQYNDVCSEGPPFATRPGQQA